MNIFNGSTIHSGGNVNLVAGVTDEELAEALAEKANIYSYEEGKRFTGNDCAFTLTKEIIEAGYFWIINNNADETVFAPNFHTIAFGDDSYEYVVAEDPAQDVEYGKPFKFVPDLSRVTPSGGTFGEDYWYEGTEVVIRFHESVYEDEFDVTICWPKSIDVKGAYDLAEDAKEQAEINGENLEAFKNQLEWKLLAEVIIEEPTEKLTLNLGSPITDWYAETLIHLQVPKNADNKEALCPNIQFGKTETEAANGAVNYPKSLYGCQSASIGALSHNYAINAMFRTQWLDRKEALLTELMSNSFNASGYPQTNYATVLANDVKRWYAQENQYITLRPRNAGTFTFPSGTILRIYGRG